MAFTAEVTQRLFMENKRLHIGTYASSGGSEGRTITVGMSKIDFLFMIPYGTAVGNKGRVNGTFPSDDGIVVVTDANESGIWVAVGV
jgi:hypothetical protein